MYMQLYSYVYIAYFSGTASLLAGKEKGGKAWLKCLDVIFIYVLTYSYIEIYIHIYTHAIIFICIYCLF
jgi:hypothetical protein